ncbi:expressed unknown protein [Seminavis robusta]|uniref:Uncharacterized protein n=1 Tax=Seminavis robusta TaxID=568900 RepID=A0A9N8ER16_9STRA|nr:expressed unknown protein [Seminavis robusta]|eukprot:Sro1706_g292481.1  (142) ;mRNA; f:995-1420
MSTGTRDEIRPSKSILEGARPPMGSQLASTKLSSGVSRLENAEPSASMIMSLACVSGLADNQFLVTYYRHPQDQNSRPSSLSTRLAARLQGKSQAQPDNGRASFSSCNGAGTPGCLRPKMAINGLLGKTRVTASCEPSRTI